jgi:hypothetical protein
MPPLFSLVFAREKNSFVKNLFACKFDGSVIPTKIRSYVFGVVLTNRRPSTCCISTLLSFNSDSVSGVGNFLNRSRRSGSSSAYSIVSIDECLHIRLFLSMNVLMPH